MSLSADRANGETIARPRTARLVLVTPEGQLIGGLPPIPVETPYWQDIRPVVESAKTSFGIDVIVLRLLETEILGSKGGEVTYLAECASTVERKALPIEPWQGFLNDQPLRLPYAKPGGPTKDLAWAMDVLRQEGHEAVGRPEQVRTWNLSSVWRIPVAGQAVWLKVVPPFFAHEGALIERLVGHPVPSVIAREGGRVLLAEVPGSDLYQTDLATMKRMVGVLVSIQLGWIGRTGELSELRLPDMRNHRLYEDFGRLVDRRAGEVSPSDRDTLSAFVSGLPHRCARIDECGLQDTLIHGDFYPGNFRGDGTRLTLIDWCDGGIGHPLLDQSAFLDWIGEDDVPFVREHWAEVWRRAVPGSSPARAADLIAPMAAARTALKAQMFLDNIEPSERVYHLGDPVDWLQATARAYETACLT